MDGGVLFNGKFLNLYEIAKVQGLTRQYLCMIFNGKRTLRLDIAISVASYLGMRLEEFVQAFDDRLRLINETEERTIKLHLDRLANEDAVDLARIKQGKPPIIRFPGLRA